MNDQLFSMTELYGVVLKANDMTTVLGRTFEKGEIICAFDKIQIGQIDPMIQAVSARGGEGNSNLIIWDKIEEVRIVFTQGIVSSNQMALLTNSRINHNLAPVDITKREFLFSDEHGVITLSENPSSTIFIYNRNGEKVEYKKMGDRSFEVSDKEVGYFIDYTISKMPLDTIEIGPKSGLGFVTLEGRTRVKGEEDGMDKTAIFVFPKVQLMTSLSIRLVNEYSLPTSSAFSANAFPVGERGNKKFFDFILLNEDVDK